MDDASLTFEAPLKSKPRNLGEDDESNFHLSGNDEENEEDDYSPEIVPQAEVPAGADESWLGDENESDADQTVRFPTSVPPISEPTPEPLPHSAAEPPTPGRQSKVKIHSEMERITVRVFCCPMILISRSNR